MNAIFFTILVAVYVFSTVGWGLLFWRYNIFGKHDKLLTSPVAAFMGLVTMGLVSVIFKLTGVI